MKTKSSIKSSKGQGQKAKALALAPDPDLDIDGLPLGYDREMWYTTTRPGLDGVDSVDAMPSDFQQKDDDDVLLPILENIQIMSDVGSCQGFDDIPSLSVEYTNSCLPIPSVQNSSVSDCGSSSDVSTLGEEDDLIIIKINQLKNTEKYDAQTANELIETWKLLSEQSGFHQNVLSMLPTLMSSTAEVLLAAIWKQQIPEDAQNLFQEYLLRSSNILEAENEKSFAKLCRNIVEMIRTDLWRPSHLQWIYEETDVPFEAAKTMWETEGCVFLETRLAMLCQVKAYDKAVLLAEACVVMGKHIECNRSLTKESATLNPFDMDEDKLEEFGAVFALILDQQDSEDDDVQRLSALKKYLSPTFCLKMTRKLISSGSSKRVAAKWKKGWKYGADVALECLEIGLPEFIKTTNVVLEELEELYSHWLTLYVKQSCDDEDQTSIEPSSFKVPDSKIENILKTAGKTDYIFALADCIMKQFPSNQIARSKCIDLCIPVLMSDINNFERLKRNELEKEEQLESGQKLSERYKNLANYFPEDNLTTFELLLTAFSLYPTQELLENLTDVAEGSSKISSENVNLSETLSSAVKAKMLGLTQVQYDDLVSVITNPRWARLNCFRSSWVEFKPLCLKYLETRGTNIKGLNDLELVTPDYAKYADLKPAYDDADGGYEPGYGPKMNGAFEEDEESDDDRNGNIPSKIREPSHRLKNLDKLNQSAQNRAEKLSKNYTYKDKLKRLMVGKAQPLPLQKHMSTQEKQNKREVKERSILIKPRGPTGARPRGRPRKYPIDPNKQIPKKLPPVPKVHKTKEKETLDPLYYNKRKSGRPRMHLEGKVMAESLLPPSLPKWDADISTNIIPFIPLPFPPEEKSEIFNASSEGGVMERVFNWMVHSPAQAYNTATIYQFHREAGSSREDDKALANYVRAISTWELISQKKLANKAKIGSYGVYLDTNYSNNENNWRNWIKFAKWEQNITVTDFDRAVLELDTRTKHTGPDHIEKEQKLQDIPFPPPPMHKDLPFSSLSLQRQSKRKRPCRYSSKIPGEPSFEQTITPSLSAKTALQIPDSNDPVKKTRDETDITAEVESTIAYMLEKIPDIRVSVSTCPQGETIAKGQDQSQTNEVKIQLERLESATSESKSKKRKTTENIKLTETKELEPSMFKEIDKTKLARKGSATPEYPKSRKRKTTENTKSAETKNLEPPVIKEIEETKSERKESVTSEYPKSKKPKTTDSTKSTKTKELEPPVIKEIEETKSERKESATSTKELEPPIIKEVDETKSERKESATSTKELEPPVIEEVDKTKSERKESATETKELEPPVIEEVDKTKSERKESATETKKFEPTVIKEVDKTKSERKESEMETKKLEPAVIKEIGETKSERLESATSEYPKSKKPNTTESTKSTKTKELEPAGIKEIGDTKSERLESATSEYPKSKKPNTTESSKSTKTKELEPPVIKEVVKTKSEQREPMTPKCSEESKLESTSPSVGIDEGSEFVVSDKTALQIPDSNDSIKKSCNETDITAEIESTMAYMLENIPDIRASVSTCPHEETITKGQSETNEVKIQLEPLESATSEYPKSKKQKTTRSNQSTKTKKLEPPVMKEINKTKFEQKESAASEYPKLRKRKTIENTEPTKPKKLESSVFKEVKIKLERLESATCEYPKSRKRKTTESTKSTETKKFEPTVIKEVVKTKSKRSEPTTPEYSEESESEPEPTSPSESEDEGSEYLVSDDELYNSHDDGDSDPGVRERRDIKPVIEKPHVYPIFVHLSPNDSTYKPPTVLEFDPLAIDPLDLGPENQAEHEFVDLTRDDDESPIEVDLPFLPQPKKRNKTSETETTTSIEEKPEELSCEQNRLDFVDATSSGNKILPSNSREVGVLEIHQNILFRTLNEHIGIKYLADLETAFSNCCKENNFGSKRRIGQKRSKGKLYSTMNKIRKAAAAAAAAESDDGCPLLEPVNLNQNFSEDNVWRDDCPPVLECCE